MVLACAILIINIALMVWFSYNAWDAYNEDNIKKLIFNLFLILQLTIWWR